MTDAAVSEADGKYRSAWSQPGSAERNSQPIAEALAPLLSTGPGASRKPAVLEVASGFGHQIHAIASRYPDFQFHPSEADGYLRSQIDERASGLPNVSKAEALDLLDQNDWLTLAHNISGEASSSSSEDGLFDGLIVCNLTHVAPWAVTESLFSHLDPRVGYVTQQGYRNLLSRQHGWIAIYGAFNENGTFTSPGNEAFDKEIRSRNPDFGLRDLQSEVIPLAHTHGYALAQRIQMPAGNLLLVFRLRTE